MTGVQTCALPISLPYLLATGQCQSNPEGSTVFFNNNNNNKYAVQDQTYSSMYPICGAVPVSYVPVRVTRGALVAHRHAYAPPRFRTSQDCRTFIPLSVSLWNDLADPVFNSVGLMGFKSRVNAFLFS